MAGYGIIYQHICALQTPIKDGDFVLNCPKVYRNSNFLGGMVMENFIEIIAVISMMVTAVMLLVQNVIEERQEKEKERLRKAKEAHNEIKKRWKEAEEKKV